MFSLFFLLIFSRVDAFGGDLPFDRLPAFDFSNHFLLKNGIDPAKILNRVSGNDANSVVDRSPNANFRNVRITTTTVGFNHSGDFLSYVVSGMVTPDAFTNNAAGVKAHAIANFYRAYIFPKADGKPLAPPLSNRRQDNLFDTRNGYFKNNPLGLWRLVFVHYTDAAFATEDGLDTLVKLAERNGLDLDGTPIIRTVSEIEELEKAGFVKLLTRNEDGSQGFPWVL